MSENRLALLDKAQSGDSDACGKMVEENSGLIWAVVRRYYGCGADPEDLFQLGCIGFIKAVKGFDITYGTQFSTYAVPKIAGEIRRFLRDDGPVKVGRTLREKGQSVWSARQRLRAALGREPKLSELAAETGRRGNCHGGASHRCIGVIAAGDGRGADTGIHLGYRCAGGVAGGKNCAAGGHPGLTGTGEGDHLSAFF